MQKHAFEVASDAFNTFRALLVTHRDVTAAHFGKAENYDHFFSLYGDLLASENYATQRQVRFLISFLGSSASAATCWPARTTPRSGRCVS